MSIKPLALRTIYSAYFLRAFIKGGSYTATLQCSTPCANPSHINAPTKRSNPQRIFILANGPSLNADIQEFIPALKNEHVLMMNHSITKPLHKQIQPTYHILLDSVYFVGDTYNIMNEQDYAFVAREVEELYSALNAASYPFDLLIPNIWRHQCNITNPNITIKTYGIAKFKGFDWIAKRLFERALGLPSYCNVLIPSIISCIAMGYKDIYILGADHSWFKNYFVDNSNGLHIDYKHFYHESKTKSHLEKYTIGDILAIDAEILRSYRTIAHLFPKHNICNLSSDSFIDAFPRDKLVNILEGGGQNKRYALRLYALLYVAYCYFILCAFFLWFFALDWILSGRVLLGQIVARRNLIAHLLNNLLSRICCKTSPSGVFL